MHTFNHFWKKISICACSNSYMQLTTISFYDYIYLAKVLIYGALDGSSATKIKSPHHHHLEFRLGTNSYIFQCLKKNFSSG